MAPTRAGTAVHPFDRITFDPEVMGGRACIRGLHGSPETRWFARERAPKAARKRQVLPTSDLDLGEIVARSSGRVWRLEVALIQACGACRSVAAAAAPVSRR